MLRNFTISVYVKQICDICDCHRSTGGRKLIWAKHRALDLLSLVLSCDGWLLFGTNKRSVCSANQMR